MKPSLDCFVSWNDSLGRLAVMALKASIWFSSHSISLGCGCMEKLRDLVLRKLRVLRESLSKPDVVRWMTLASGDGDEGRPGDKVPKKATPQVDNSIFLMCVSMASLEMMSARLTIQPPRLWAMKKSGRCDDPSRVRWAANALTMSRAQP
jgi:hypothetical protein